MEIAEEDIRQFFRESEEYVRAIGQDLGPQEDWEPSMTMLLDEGRNEQGRLAVGFVMFDPKFFDNQLTKQALGVAIIGILREAKPVAASFVSTAWVSNPKTAEARILMNEKIMTPGMDPDRRECVFVLHCDRDGKLAYSSAEVKRSDGPPELGDWDRKDEDSGERLGGLFSDAMRQGFADE